jgi:hypothetical protein
MKLIEFLENFSKKNSILKVLTDDIEIKDYFINVVYLLFDIHIIVNNKNMFGEVETNYNNDILLINYSGNVPNNVKTIYRIKDDNIIEEQKEVIEEVVEEVNNIIKEPIHFFKLLTM